LADQPFFQSKILFSHLAQALFLLFLMHVEGFVTISEIKVT